MMKMQRKRVSSMMNRMIDGMENRSKRRVNGKIDGMKGRRRWDENNEEEKVGCGGGGVMRTEAMVGRTRKLLKV